MLKPIKFIFVFFFLIIISLFSILFLGIKIDSFSFGNFSVSQFYIKLNKKLIVDVDKIIFKSKKSSVTNSYEDLKRDIELLPKLLKIFERINVERLIIDGNEFTIQLNDEFLYLDNNFVNISSKVDFISNQVVFDLYSLYLKDVNVLFDGKVKLDYFSEKLDYYGSYLYDDKKGDIKINIKDQILMTYLNSQSFKSLDFLKKYLHLSNIAENWMYDNVVGDITLKEFYGAYDLKNNKLLTKTLNGKAVIDNAIITFHKDVEPIITKSVDIDFDNDKLTFKLNEPKYLDIPLDDSNVVIHNLTSADNGEVEINIKTQAKLDEKVNKVLKAFKINIPIVQKSGSTIADVKLIIPYLHSKHMTTLGEFDIKDSSLFIGKFNFNSKSAKVYLDGTKITIKDADFKYKKMIDSILNLTLDTKTLISSGDAIIKSFYIGNSENEILNIKNLNSKLDMNFNNSVQISLKDLLVSLDINDLINVKIDDISKLYNYSKLLKDNKIPLGNITLNIKDENNLDFDAQIAKLDYPIEKNEQKIDSLKINGKIKEGNLLITSKNEDIKLEKNINDILKLSLKNIDINLANNDNSSNDLIPTMFVKLENAKLKFKDDTYFINSATANLNPQKISFDAKVSQLDLPLVKNEKKISLLDIKGNYSKEETNIYTKNNDLNLIIKDDDISVNLNGYDILYSTNEEKNENSEKQKFNLTAKNSNIIINDKYKFLADNYELRLREKSRYFHLNYKDSDITFKEDENKKVDIFANNISDKFINTIFSKNILVGGKYMLLAKGELNNLDGKFLIENAKVEDLAILNNLLLFIHTSPALINPVLAIPSLVGMATNGGFNLTGYQITNGNIEFNYNKKKELLDIKKLLTVGNGIDFDGKGNINLADMTIKSNIKLIFLKDYSRIVGAIPVINYLFLGESNRVETEVDVFGELNNPQISTNLTKDTFSVPVNIAKRILESPSKLLDFIKEQSGENESELLNKPK